MRAKDYLSQINVIHAKVENKRERIERLKVLLESPAIPDLKPDKVQTSISQDKMSKMISEKAELEDELQRLMYEEAALIIKIGKQIDALEDVRYTKLLHLRYEEGLPLWKIARMMHYEYNSIRNMHGRALLEFERQFLISDIK